MLNQLWHDLWVLVFAVLILIGMFAAQGLLVGFGVMGLLVAGISWLWNRLSLEDVSYQREVSDQKVFIDEELTLSIILTNRKPVPLGRVRIEDSIPSAIEIADADVIPSPNPDMQILRHSGSMTWYERVRWDYRVKCGRRGYFRLGPARVSGGDLLGLFASEKAIGDRDYILVYPRVVPLPQLGLPAVRPLGEVTSDARIFEDTSRPMGIRDYEPGDSMRIVDWKATARSQQLKARTYQPSSTVTVTLAVAVDTTEHYWEGYSTVNLERVITAAASVASYASEQQYSLGLFSNGTPVLADRPMKIAPSRAPEQLPVILEVLATVRPLAMGPMATHLVEYARRFAFGSTLVLVTAYVQPGLPEAIATLKAMGHRIVVLYVADEPCPPLPEGVTLYEIGPHFQRMGFASEFGPR